MLPEWVRHVRSSNLPLFSGKQNFHAGIGRNLAADGRDMPHDAASPRPGQLEESFRHLTRLRHLSYRTEQTYWDWIKRFIFFHHKQHPRDMGAAEVGAFLTHLAVNRAVASSTQNQALNACLSGCLTLKRGLGFPKIAQCFSTGKRVERRQKSRQGRQNGPMLIRFVVKGRGTQVTIAQHLSAGWGRNTGKVPQGTAGAVLPSLRDFFTLIRAVPSAQALGYFQRPLTTNRISMDFRVKEPRRGGFPSENHPWHAPDPWWISPPSVSRGPVQKSPAIPPGGLAGTEPS